MGSFNFSIEGCTGSVRQSAKAEIVVEGQIETMVKDNIVEYIAAAPTDLRASYTGSGLPFASPEMAMQGTPNKGTITLEAGNAFKINLKMPNSHYAALGTVLVPPTLYLTFFDMNLQKERTVSIVVDEPIPYRTLTYPNQRTSAMFYDVKLPVRSQEQILRDSAYPCQMVQAPNFWGLKPPC